MADYEDLDERGGLSRSGFVLGALDIFGTLVIIASPIWFIATLAKLGQAETMPNGAAWSAAGWMLAGVIVGIALLGVGEIIRKLGSIQAVGEHPSPSPIEHAPYYAGRAVRGDIEDNKVQTLEELVVLTREVRDISLLTEEQRSLRLQAQGKAVLEVLQREVPILLREHNWIEARNRVQDSRERFPHFDEWDALEQQIEQMRTQVEAHDLEAAERQIHDLTSLGAWDRVAEVIDELLERHPDSLKAIEMAHGIRDQRHKAEAEQRARLMAQAQEASNSREWKAALSAATALVDRFPKSAEAQAVRLQLPTLKENAEIQERKQLESRISEFIKQQRLDDALRTTRDLLQQYPDSPQAAKAREMLPKLEEKVTAMGPRY